MVPPPLDVAGAVERQAGMELASAPAPLVSEATRLILMDSADGRVLAAFPADHQIGIATPKGGSCCANCRFVADGGRGPVCTEPTFIAWEGAGKPAGSSAIPGGDSSAYCSDLWQMSPTPTKSPTPR